VVLAAFLGLRGLRALQPEPVGAPMRTGTVMVVAVTDRSSLTGSDWVVTSWALPRQRWFSSRRFPGWTGAAALPPRTHLGDFFQRVVEGDASHIITRKAVAATGSILNPLRIACVLVGVVVWVCYSAAWCPRCAPSSPHFTRSL
jgi:hypothetical protein